MTDHLSQMGVQRWHLRSGPVMNDSDLSQGVNPAIESPLEANALGTKTFDDMHNAQLAPKGYVETVDHSSAVSQPVIDNNRFSAYAGISVRVNAEGQENCWLWVVPQEKLPFDELQLLDKIVIATQSNWQSSGVADSYLTEQELDNELQKSLSTIVILGDIKHQWQSFFKHDIYQQKRFIMGISLQDMLSDTEKKRSVWKSLQALL